MNHPGSSTTPNKRAAVDRGLVAMWVLSRALLLGISSRYPLMASDLSYYFTNAHQHGLRTGMPEYPLPIAVALMAPARALNFISYVVVFVAVILAIDLMITWLLARAFGALAARGWILFVVLLGPVGYLRFDPLVAAAITISIATVRRRPALSGLAVAAGAAIKLWPAVLGVGVTGPRAQRARHTAGALLAGLTWAGLVVLTAGFKRLFSPLVWQSGRGFEFESPLASLLGLVRATGDHSIRWAHHRGSWEYVGPLATDLLPLVSIIEYTGLILILAVVLLGFRTGATGSAHSYALTITTVILILIITSPVLSPQYLIWLGPGLCVVRDARLRQLAYAACLLTQIEFPFLYEQLFTGHGTLRLLTALTVVFRDVLLVALAALAIRLQIRAAFPQVTLLSRDRPPLAS